MVILVREIYKLHEDLNNRTFDLGKLKLTPLRIKVINCLFIILCAFFRPGKDVKKIKKTFTSYDGKKISATLFEPKNIAPNAPCLIYYHGGGFIFRESNFQLRNACYYAKNANCKTVFVHYRTAPENPFPAPVEDAYSSLLWVNEHADELGINKDKIAVGGDSAGGALAAAVTQMARDRKGPEICFQMLIYPVTDCTQTSSSIKEFFDAPNWNANLTRQMWQLYLKDGYKNMLPYASPMCATSFSNLPPAYIETQEFDCLRDEGNNYAYKLQESDVEVTLKQLKGTIHGFDVNGNTNLTKQALMERENILKTHFKSEKTVH